MNMMAPLITLEPQLTRTEVAGLVALAARTVPPLWPLESAIAVNPLAGLEEQPFAAAVKLAAARFGARQSLPLAQWRALLRAGQITEKALRDAAIRALGGIYSACRPVLPGVSALDLLMARLIDLPPDPDRAPPACPDPATAFVAKWCAAYFDQGQAVLAMPHRELGFYRAVLAAIAHDPEFRALTGTAGQPLLLSVPRDPLEAIAEGLVALAVADGTEQDRLAALVARLPGWAGHIRWRTEHADLPAAEAALASMADLIALWLLLERAGALAEACLPPEPDRTPALLAHFGLTSAALGEPVTAQLRALAAISEDTLGSLFQIAAEWTYRNALAPRLQAAALDLAPDAQQGDQPDAQLVFCIDVRSEPFRRALEAEGHYETFGYAGFFGLPIARHGAGETGRTRLLPVLLAPQYAVSEAPVPGRERAAGELAGDQARARLAADLLAASKQGSATAFATAEAAGPLAALLMTARTLAPGLVQRIGTALSREPQEVLAPAIGAHTASGHDHGHAAPFTLANKIGFAQALFKLTGLTAPFARIVALVGHGGSTVNNPYAAALDCGACGGHAGGFNARVLATILNQPEVRTGLAAQGQAIPETTWFVAAEHNTTTDRVTVFDRQAVPDSHRPDLAALEASLATAGQVNRARRAAQLGRRPDDLLTGALHWGEVRPEWGLAGNAAFIVGPRALTRGIDLAGQAFLHSYDWRGDPDATALTTILTAPMVVAQWINCQYLFSTLDNERYGSGDKVTQNVVGGIGVLQGNGGDLRIGLPRQSLFRDDGTPFHVPRRLLTVVLAPFDRVARVVQANPILDRLFGKDWVTLMVIDPTTGQVRLWRSSAPEPGEGAQSIAMTTC